MNALQVGFFPGAIVEVAEVVDADDAISLFEQRLGRVRPDESRRPVTRISAWA